MARYVRLYVVFWQQCLVREMTFRANFLLRCGAHVVWLGVMLLFFEVVFGHTQRIGAWDHDKFLFFMGTSLLLNATINSLFIVNLARFAELVRTGGLDYVLLKPIDEQFLISCQRFDMAILSQLPLGGGLMLYGASASGLDLHLTSLLCFVVLFVAAVALLYSLLLLLASFSVWIVQTGSLFEAWFQLNQFTRYPSDVFEASPLGRALAFVLTYLFPIVLAVNVPARFAVDVASSPKSTAGLLIAAVVALSSSRAFLRFALRRYRSASS